VKKISIYILLFLSALAFLSCSQESTSKVSKGYHNTTAHYNAYFLAKEKMKEIETTLFQKTNTDYNKVLDLYPVYDTTYAKTLRPQFDECIKKASLPIQWHKNSRWVDNSFILIGKCRLYGLDLTNAESTFKFVNAKGTDEQDKFEALILLMRTYIESKQFDYAAQVYEHLATQDLNKKNQRELALNKAFDHQIHLDYAKEAEELEKAYSKIKNKDFKSRVMFILAQIYQQLGNDPVSYSFYRKVLKNNPPYELSFYTKLYMAQVSTLENATVKKLYKYFFKLLKDPKNKEYKDKIYYELAKFELKQNNIPQSIDYLKKSLKEGNNPSQKAYTFLKLGKIHYDKLKKFVTAQQYYDSCLTFLPKNNPDYLAIKNRSVILDEFVKHYTVMQTQDSLLTLATKSEKEIDAVLEAVIAEDIKKQKLAYETSQKAKKEAENASFANNMPQNGNIGGNNLGGDANAKWYFYNPTTLANGKMEFAKIWGNRPNEDNWRRSQKEVAFDNNNPNNNSPENVIAQKNTENTKSKKEEKFEPVPLDKKKMYETIPFSKKDQDSANAKLAKAYQNLGRIYYSKLKETENAVDVYENHLRKYPNHEKDAEIIYSLYLIFNQENNDVMKEKLKAKLIAKHPHSLYAKLIQNPNYLTENKAQNELVRKSYREIYLTYENGAYSQADTMIFLLLNQYPDNDIMDKLDYLQAIIKGKQQNWSAYSTALEGIKTKYPGTPYQKNAEYLLEVYAKNTQKSVSNTDSLPKTNPLEIKTQPEKTDSATNIPKNNLESEPKMNKEDTNKTNTLPLENKPPQNQEVPIINQEKKN